MRVLHVHLKVQTDDDDQRLVTEIRDLIAGAITVGSDTDAFHGLDIEITQAEEE